MRLAAASIREPGALLSTGFAGVLPASGKWG